MLVNSHLAFYLRQGLVLFPNVHMLGYMAWEPPGIVMFLSRDYRCALLVRLFVLSGDQSPGPHVWEASTLLIEPALSLVTVLKEIDYIFLGDSFSWWTLTMHWQFPNLCSHPEWSLLCPGHLSQYLFEVLTCKHLKSNILPICVPLTFSLPFTWQATMMFLFFKDHVGICIVHEVWWRATCIS